MLEKTVKAAVKKRLNELGCYQHWVVPMGYGATTVDVLGCLPNGRFFAVECKRPGGRPNLKQQLILSLIQALNGLVAVVDNVEDARRLFDGST